MWGHISEALAVRPTWGSADTRAGLWPGRDTNAPHDGRGAREQEAAEADGWTSAVCASERTVRLRRGDDSGVREITKRVTSAV